jgi:hypothetical protein
VGFETSRAELADRRWLRRSLWLASLNLRKI